MSFLITPLRIIGTVTAAGLGAPLVLGIGGGATSLGILVADACRQGNMPKFAELLRKMDDAQVRAIGMDLVALCPLAETKQKAAEILQQERSRRGI